MLAKEIAMLLVYEVTRDLALSTRVLDTPLQNQVVVPTLENEHIVLVSVLRAGNGLLDGALELIPSARVGYLGLYRDHETLMPVEYYCKFPPSTEAADVIILDPMLATGHSAAAAATRVLACHPRSVKMVHLIAAPEGIRHFEECHPQIPLYVAAIDEKLNELSYIVPGLGDAGDRLFGTK
jgi:uracil phosphoribosyltransferase